MNKRTTKKQVMEMCTDILINAKQIGKRGQKTELTRRNPWRKRSFAMNCIAI